MNRTRLRARWAALPLLALAVPARAETDHFEIWLSPSVATAIGPRTSVELETAQRFRDAADGGRDTVYARAWVHRKLSDDVTLSGAIEQRWNDRAQEQRLHQQLAVKWGPFGSRSRLEQRFVEGDPRMAIRLRQRFGVERPIAADGRLSGVAHAEAFVTLRSGSSGGQTGLTSVRLYAGVARDIGDRWSLSLGYMRAQDIRDGAPDRVGHAPLVGIKLTL